MSQSNPRQPRLLAEDLLLLMLDEGRAGFLPMPPDIQALALSGAVLMDLQLGGRIDTDVNMVLVVAAGPTGDDILDPALAAIAGGDRIRSVHYWLDRGMKNADRLRELALTRLIEKGVLEADSEGLPTLPPGVSRGRHDSRLPAQVPDVKSEIVRLVTGTDIPGPRETAVICMADACGVLEGLLDRDELDEARDRAMQLRQMDLIGSAMCQIAETIWARPALGAQCPTARGLPLIGNAISMLTNLRAFLTEQYQELGPVFRLRVPGDQFVVLGGPEANMFVTRRGHHLMTTEALWREFCDKVGVSRVVLSMDGADHIRMRKHWTPNASHRAFIKKFEKVVDQTKRDILDWPENTKLQGFPALKRVISNQLGLVMAGMAPEEYTDDIMRYFRETLIVHVAKQKPFHFRRLRYRRSERRVREFGEKVLAAHRVPRRQRDHDFVDDLIALHRTDPVLLSELDLAFNALVPFMAGLDTAASSCAIMLYVLLKRRDLMDRVRTEAAELFSEETPPEEAVRRLDVTRRVAMEALRMYPPVEVIQRTVTNSFEFGGYRIAAGEKAIVGTTIPHYLPEYFTEPERFDIDRYLPGRDEHKQPGAYAPFGVGVHRCAGQGIAQVQIVFTIALIAHLLDIKLDPPDYELGLNPMVTSSPNAKFRFVVTSRR